MGRPKKEIEGTTEVVTPEVVESKTKDALRISLIEQGEIYPIGTPIADLPPKYRTEKKLAEFKERGVI